MPRSRFTRADVGRMPTLEANRTRRDGGNDVNDPQATLTFAQRAVTEITGPFQKKSLSLQSSGLLGPINSRLSKKMTIKLTRRPESCQRRAMGG